MKSRVLRRSALVFTLAGLLSGCADLVPVPTSKYSFGEVFVGTTKQSPPVRWRNRGEKSRDVLGLVVFGPFTIQGGTPTFNAFQLDSGQETPPILFSFSPVVEGRVSGDAVPQIAGAEGSVQGYQMDGEGVYLLTKGALGIGGSQVPSGGFLEFGKVQMNAGYVEKRINLVNSSANPITVKAKWEQGINGFMVARPAGPIVVPPRFRSVRVVIGFKPTNGGVITNAVVFEDVNDSQNRTGIATRGEGIE